MKVERLSRREFLGLAASAAAGTALAACQPQVVERTIEVTKIVQEEVPVEQTVVVREEVEVTAIPPAGPAGQLIFWGHDDHPIDLAATGFVEKYPEIEWISPHPADRGEKLRGAMAAGEGCPDLYWAEADEAQNWGCEGLLVDLTEFLAPEKDNYHPLKWNETVVPTTGKNIGWPGDISVSGWYYRADLMDALGYGDVDFSALDYDEFCEIASELADQGKYTFLFPAAGWYQAMVCFGFRLFQVGGSMVSKDGQTITVGDERGIEAMRITKQLWDCGGGLDVDWLGPPYFAAMKADELIGQFAAAWEAGFWESNLTPEEGGLGSWRVVPFFSGPTIRYRTGIFGGAQLVCPNCAQNKENAVAFMQYCLGSLEGCALCGAWGIIPSYRPYLQSPLFLRDKTALFGDWPHNEFWAAQEKELSLEYVRPAGIGAVYTALGEVIPSIMRGEVSIEDGLAQVVDMASSDFERSKCALD